MNEIGLPANNQKTELAAQPKEFCLVLVRAQSIFILIEPFTSERRARNRIITGGVIALDLSSLDVAQVQ
jgi:hypothetical protein